MTPIIAGAGAVGWALAMFAWWALYRWERQLKGARIAIAYKRRVVMQPTLNDVLGWALILKRDKRNNGQVFFRQGGVTVAILKPLRGHGRTRTRKVKENPGVRDRLRGFHRGREAPPAPPQITAPPKQGAQ